MLHFRKLETRLLVSFLLLAFVPAALLTFVAMRRISGAIDRLQNPGVERSLAHSAALSAEFVDRLAADADYLFDALPPSAPDDDETLSWVRGTLESERFDFAAWEPAGSESRIVAVAELPEDVSLPAPEAWTALAAGRTPPVIDGRTLRFFRIDPDGERPARAVGLLIAPGIADALVSAEGDFGRYLQLQLFEEIQKSIVWFSSAVILLLTAAAAYGIARVTARRISRPVEELAQAADRVAAGDFASRVRVHGEGEVTDLGIAFNRMTAELERSRDELVRVERIAAWRDVARRVAHEIRNPLTPIKLAVHRLERRVSDDDATRECLRSIGEEVENLERISESFSGFAKMPEPRFGPADFAAVVKSVRDLFSEAAGGVEIVYEGPDSLPVVADRDQLRRATSNLVKNALEALGSSGTARLRLSKLEDLAMLEVIDDGPGVPPEIRDSFLRPGVSGKPGGSGLGLAMVQRIAMDHHGALKWEDLDGGTRFVLEIPLRAETPPESMES